MYYLITGLDEGKKIKPYITTDLDCLNVYGDEVRYYEPFKSEREAISRLKELLRGETNKKV